jgi:NADH-ubiquinone oxidoreductase chain 1
VESELVSGFMTEHSAVIFVFFFLAEYASIVLICILTSILFLGGYLNFLPLYIFSYIYNLYTNSVLYLFMYEDSYNILNGYCWLYETLSSFNFLINGTISSFNLAFKTSILIFVFIWTRASFPRIRFDQLMSVCWTILLPIVIGYIVMIPCIILGLGLIPTNIFLL